MREFIQNLVYSHLVELEKLISALSPVTYEKLAIDFLTSFYKEHGFSTRTDRVGNLIVWRGDEKGKVALVSHVDNVAFMVASTNSVPFLLSPLGSPLPLEITEAICLQEEGRIEGVIYKLDEKKWGFEPYINKENIEAGDLVLYAPYIKIVEDKVIAPFLDDKINVFAMMVLALAWSKKGESEFPFISVHTVREESGGRGSMVVPQSLPRLEEAIILDVVYGSSPYFKTEVGVGEGVGICFKDAYSGDRERLLYLKKLAQKNGIPYQLEIVDAGGSDLKNIYWQNGGIKTAYVGVPAANCHTPREIASLEDVVSLVQLLWSWAKD